jgi:diguanylate cyclase (GGDEF)-like protein
MIESSPAVGHDRSTPSPVPIVSLAAIAQGASAIARASTAWRSRARPKTSRIADEQRFPDSWFKMFKGMLKTVAPPRDGARSKLRKFEDYRQSRLGRKITGLQRIVVQMREELRGAQEREKRARYMAFHDELTALPNRRFFRERLERALADVQEQPPRLAVIYLDLDGFKALNDAYGHDTGDRLLTLIAARLSHAVRAEDLVSRLGGDEYACLITGVSSRERLQLIASTLFKAVSTPFTIGTLALTVRPSIGIAVYPADGTTTDALLKAADTAMYHAKRTQSLCSFSEAHGAITR